MAIALLLGIALAGCGRTSVPAGPSPPPRYQSVDEVRGALERADLGCTDLRIVGDNHRDYGEEDAVETGTCLVDNREASISMWSSLGEKQDWIRQRAAIGCQFTNDMGDDPPAYVDGGFWTVRVDTSMLAERVARGIGGEPRTTDCRSAWIDDAG